jgi:hypothetical protein
MEEEHKNIVDFSPRTTIKELTINNDYIGHGESNVKSTYIIDNEYIAKPTIKQSTLSESQLGGINKSDNGNYLLPEEMKMTIKQTTLSQSQLGGINKSDNGNYILPDEMKPTTRQTTLLENYTGNTKTEVHAPPTHMSENNMSINERREIISSFNRNANGKGDVYGPYIDKDNVKLIDPILYSYIAPPKQNLDYSVTPIPTNECITQLYKNSRPTIGTSSYYINNDFINTLDNNPYVNDIYHQKNI